jgi:hypothetical protein
MGFRVVTNTSHDWIKIAELAGADPFLNIWHPDTSELECESTDQAILDTALADYVADQTNIDQAKADAQIAVDKAKEKEALDMRRVLKAILGGLVGEINLLRAQHSLPNRTDAQVRNAIRNLIDAG